MRIETEEELLAFRYGLKLGALEERQLIMTLIKGENQ